MKKSELHRLSRSALLVVVVAVVVQLGGRFSSVARGHYAVMFLSSMHPTLAYMHVCMNITSAASPLITSSKARRVAVIAVLP